MSRPRRPSVRRTLLVGGLLLAAVALLAFHWDLRSHLQRAVEFFRDAGPAPFFVAMALLPAAGFPLSMFTVAVALVFVPTLGLGIVLACTLLAVAVNVALSYWIAARALRPLVARIVRRFGYNLPEIQPHAAWPIILLVRIVPGPPFFVQSYLLGLARVPFGTYLAISTSIPALYLVGTIVLTDALARHDRWTMAAAVALFVVAGGVLHQARRRLSATGIRPVVVTRAIDPLAESRN